jgi:hypothetical protein
MAHFIPSAGVHRKGSSNSTTTAFCAPLKKKRRWAPGSLVVCARSQRHLRYEYHRHQSNRSTHHRRRQHRRLHPAAVGSLLQILIARIRKENANTALLVTDGKACLCRSGKVGADPLTRTVGVAVRGSVGDASRRHGGFPRALGASTPPALPVGPCQARARALRAGEGYGSSIRRCAGRPGQDAPVPEPSILRRQQEAGRESCEAFSFGFLR